jgi:membrane protein required for beta-lactamase induction
MEEDLLPFDRAARDARAALNDMGPVARQMEALYDDACAVEANLTSMAKSRGQPGAGDMRATMEWNLIGLWIQLLGQFRQEFLRTSLIQGAEIANAPRVNLTDIRDLKHRPDRGRLN